MLRFIIVSVELTILFILLLMPFAFLIFLIKKMFGSDQGFKMAMLNAAAIAAIPVFFFCAGFMIDIVANVFYDVDHPIIITDRVREIYMMATPVWIWYSENLFKILAATVIWTFILRPFFKK